MQVIGVGGRVHRHLFLGRCLFFGIGLTFVYRVAVRSLLLWSVSCYLYCIRCNRAFGGFFVLLLRY